MAYARAFGFADMERGEPFTVDTPNDGGSIAKAFTAAAVHKLSSAGQLDLEAPVQRHVPS